MDRNTVHGETQIRPWREDDDLSALTALLHRAYKPLADAGMRFMASHQDEATTLRRLRKGRAFVAEVAGELAGTIAYYPPGSHAGCEAYRQPGVAVFGQFAIEPALQRCGLGTQLLNIVEQCARSDGASALALDTSEHAAELIRWYSRRGFTLAGRTRWPEVNYDSVILQKALCR